MYRVLVTYERQTEPERFRAHYEAVHMPLVAALPGVRDIFWSFDIRAMDGAPDALFGVFHCAWEDEAAHDAAMQSAQARAMMDDIPRYVSGPMSLIRFADAR